MSSKANGTRRSSCALRVKTWWNRTLQDNKKLFILILIGFAVCVLIVFPSIARGLLWLWSWVIEPDYNAFTGPIVLNLVASLSTATALLWAVYTWRASKNDQKKSLINSLLEECVHNLNIADMYVERPNLEQTEMMLYYLKELTPLGEYPIYEKEKPGSDTLTKMISSKLGPLERDYSRLRMQVTAIERCIDSGLAVNILTARMFVNLGLLHYSLRRYNQILAKFEMKNPGTDYAGDSKNEYIKWVHFRLWFFMLDLVSDPETHALIINRPVLKKFKVQHITEEV